MNQLFFDLRSSWIQLSILQNFQSFQKWVDMSQAKWEGMPPWSLTDSFSKDHLSKVETENFDLLILNLPSLEFQIPPSTPRPIPEIHVAAPCVLEGTNGATDSEVPGEHPGELRL